MWCSTYLDANSLQNCDSYVTRRMGWIERSLAGERWAPGQLGSAEILHILSSLLQPGFGGMTGTISVISQGRHEKMAMFQSGSGVWTDVIYFILFQFKQLLGLILFDNSSGPYSTEASLFPSVDISSWSWRKHFTRRQNICWAHLGPGIKIRDGFFMIHRNLIWRLLLPRTRSTMKCAVKCSPEASGDVATALKSPDLPEWSQTLATMGVANSTIFPFPVAFIKKCCTQQHAALRRAMFSSVRHSSGCHRSCHGAA